MNPDWHGYGFFPRTYFFIESSDVHVDLFIYNVINYNTSILKTSANCCTSRTKLYDKRNDFTFPIINSKPFISTIPSAPAYISQLIRYCRDCTQYSSFHDRQGTLVVGWSHCYKMLTVMEVYMLYFVLHYDLLLNRKTEQSSIFFFSKLSIINVVHVNS